jgi:hypothetical protein
MANIYSVRIRLMCSIHTTGIKISCNEKRELYLLSRESNDPKLCKHYKLYCKILSQVIKASKESYYNKYIADSDNRTKATWNIVKTLTGNKIKRKEISHININNTLTDNYQLIVNSFNTYFLTVTENIIKDISSNNDPSQDTNPLVYLINAFKQPFPKIQFKNTSTKEIEKNNSVLNSKKLLWM